MKVGIVFDSWKLPIFKRHLTEAGLAYVPLSGIPAGTLGLHVETDDTQALEKIVRAAQSEATTTMKGSPDAN
jgi:hypothetical protein